MAFWLFKQEPSSYGLADLERDGTTVWDGVSNALALKNLRSVQPKDRVFFYHTGKEKAIVGEMRVMAKPHAPADDPKAVVVDVAFVRKFSRPVTLAEVKADKFLADWELVRLPRLSVVPVSATQWQRVEELIENAG
jgi:predicted RNA-binding protein with PUA-like domain